MVQECCRDVHVTSISPRSRKKDVSCHYLSFPGRQLHYDRHSACKESAVSAQCSGSAPFCMHARRRVTITSNARRRRVHIRCQNIINTTSRGVADMMRTEHQMTHV